MTEDLTAWAARNKDRHMTEFESAFAEARRRGLPFFFWRGKPYHTRRADEPSDPTIGILVPRREGPELVEISENGAKALPGTGFNPNSRQHMIGSQAVRYAIALQQLRDDQDFVALDLARSEAQRSYIVMQERDGTRLVAFETVRGPSGGGERRKAVLMPICEQEGILYDGPAVTRAAPRDTAE